MVFIQEIGESRIFIILYKYFLFDLLNIIILF